ncbi:MAG TPA: globin [Chloroflexota bacterium]|jgi:hemoglobin
MADSLYDRVGGEPFFVDLVNRFYDRVESDPVLRPLYPSDMGPSRRHLAMFLAQYWGGPPAYNQERGHPRLRMRHVPFAIGAAERDAWLEHMLSAVAASPASAADREALRGYFQSAASSLVNRFPQPSTPGMSLDIHPA